jgi:hypothetical protein
MHELHTDIEVEATAERVWSVLTDFAAFPEWNPFIRWIRGTPERAKSLVVRLQPSGAGGTTFRPTVLVADRPRELRWIGRLFVRGIFDGEHCFRIHPLSEGRVRFEHSERFTGVLVALFRPSLDRDTKRGFQEMNRALKERCERGSRASA